MPERQRTVAEKIEIVGEVRAHGWSVVEAARNLQIPRTTLIGYLDAEETLRSTDVEPSSRRASRPGQQVSTHEIEAELADLITRRANEGRRMSRADVIAECSQRIPLFAQKSSSAQNSWLTRFLKRHRLANSIARYPKKPKVSTTQVTQEAPPPATPVTQEAPPPATQVIQEAPPPATPVTQEAPPPATQVTQEAPPPATPVTQEAPPPATQVTQEAPPPATPVTQEAPEVVVIDDEDEGDDNPRNVDINPKVCETMAISFRSDRDSYRLEVTEADVGKLRPGVWLNDTVVTYYIREYMIAHERTFNFDAQLFGTILQNYQLNGRNMKATYEKIRGITEQFPYETYGTVLVPVCMDYHWSFVIIQNPASATDGTTPSMLHVDSRGSHDTGKINRVLGGFFRQEARAKFGKARVQYSVKGQQTYPRQDNSSDCGVFMLFFMERFNQALRRANGELQLFDSAAAICKMPRLNCDRVRMSYTKKFRNDGLLQATPEPNAED